MRSQDGRRRKGPALPVPMNERSSEMSVQTPVPSFLPSHSYANVVHYYTGFHGRDASTQPNSKMRDKREWVRWLYLDNIGRSTSVVFNVGHTRAFVEHVDATLAFNASLCPSQQASRCRWLPPEVVHHARTAGLDSIQFVRHTMDRYRPKPRFEIVDLQPWRPLVNGLVLGRYSGLSGTPCCVWMNETTQRMECVRETCASNNSVDDELSDVFDHHAPLLNNSSPSGRRLLRGPGRELKRARPRGRL